MAEFEFGGWYRINQPDGNLWMETSDPDEVYRESKRTGWPVELLWQRTEYEWRPHWDWRNITQASPPTPTSG